MIAANDIYKAPADVWARLAAPLASETISWRRRVRWTALAFVPSSLLMAVTSYMSTDVASVPLMWMVPLGVYLGTFVAAFSARGGRARALAGRFMPLAIIGLTLLIIAQMNQPAAIVIPVHLAAFAIIALACHGTLVDVAHPARPISQIRCPLEKARRSALTIVTAPDSGASDCR